MPKAPATVRSQCEAVPEFVAASSWLQDAIVAVLDEAPKNDDGTVTLYPSPHAWVDVRRPGGATRTVQAVSIERAAFLLAHIPPPFYTTEEAARVGHLLAERPAPALEPVTTTPGSGLDGSPDTGGNV
jgi:hypothetical protein